MVVDEFHVNISGVFGSFESFCCDINTNFAPYVFAFVYVLILFEMFACFWMKSRIRWIVLVRPLFNLRFFDYVLKLSEYCWQKGESFFFWHLVRFHRLLFVITLSISRKWLGDFLCNLFIIPVNRVWWKYSKKLSNKYLKKLKLKQPAFLHARNVSVHFWALQQASQPINRNLLPSHIVSFPV